MPTLKQTLSYLILGQKSGKNRIQIIDLLNERPFNLHQLAEKLNLNYRTVQHHIDVLKKNELVSSSKAGGYGEVYFLTQEMENNMELFKNIVNTFTDFTSKPGFFQNILEQTNDPVIIIDENSEVYFWNKAAEETFGYSNDEVIGHSIRLFPELDDQKVLLDRISNGEHIVSHETQFKHKTGQLIDVNLTMDGIQNEYQELVGFFILTKDISERKEEEQKLKASAEKYRTLFEASPDNVYVLDKDGSFIDVNPKTIERLGYSKDELVGKPLPMVFTSASQKIFQEKFPKLLEEGHQHAEVELVTKNGSIINVDCLATAIRNSEGEIENIIVFERDITERKKEEETEREA
jgi:PAS domain S-box-containing protein